MESPSSVEQPKNPEKFDPHSVAVVTATRYPSWYAGEVKGELTTDKMRGDLALQMFGEASSRGYQISIVDSGSSEEFLGELERKGVNFQKQKEKGFQGQGRREALTEAVSLPGVKVLFTVEPEKISMITDCLPQTVQPILDGEADIVAPKRIQSSYDSLPPNQAKEEQWSNQLINNMLRKRGILKEEQEDIDFKVGVKAFANKPEVVDLFMQRYKFKPADTKLHQLVNLDQYNNPLFFPVIEALRKGMRVKSVDVPYVHPRIQTDFEFGRPEFDEKRNWQKRELITGIIHFIRRIENSRKKRIAKLK